MVKSHESGLPFAYDRAGERPEWRGLVFHGERPFLQSAELQDMQTILRNEVRQLGRLVAKDGDRIQRADAVVDVAAGTVTLTEGVIYVEGSQLPVAEAVLTGVPMDGRAEIGVRLVKSWITHEDDPALVGPIPGSLAEGEPGAAREIWSIVWATPGDGEPGSFYSVYTLQNGAILDQTGPSILEPALQALAAYDRPNGNYVVSGCRVTALGADAGAQVFSIEQGEANINGYKRTRFAALRIAEPEAWDEIAIPGETHAYTAGASCTFSVDEFPIGVINSILLTKEKTVTLTRGAIAAGTDGLPDNSVIQLVLVKQGGTTYVAGTDYVRTGNAVDWVPVGAEPAIGSTYEVTYRYRASVVADSRTDKTITVSGGVADAGGIIVSYTRKLPRIDRIGLREDGSAVYIKGVSARANPVPPQIPFDIARLATVSNDWMGQPSVVNDGTRFITVEEQWRFNNRIVDHERLIQLERLKSGIDAREPVAKKGMFVDPFVDDTYRDAGTVQTAAVGLGMLQLAIDPTFHKLGLSGSVMLDYVEEVIVAQELKTGCEKINPYANFSLLPASMALSPAVDFWTVSQTQWLSSQTIAINRGTTVNGPLETRSDADEVVDRRLEQAEFLREIPVNFEIGGFGAGEILAELTFDDINVKPAGVIAANGAGKVTGSFVIPAKVTAGTKTVYAKGAGGKDATALFTGQGTIEVDVMRRVTTVNTWQRAVVVGRPPAWATRGSDRSPDPQAQGFTPPEARQILGVDFHLCAIGNQSRPLLVEQVTMDNGYPTNDIQAQAAVSMAGALVGWKSARYGLPVTTFSDRLSAFVIKSDDNQHSVSIAKLGGFDATLQKHVAAHPYVIAPRFSSVNAVTWSAHQDEALAFRLIAARFTATTKTVDLGTVNLVGCSDIQIRAAVELPSAACSVVFEVERTNGTIYRLLPFQLLSLPEKLTETVEIRAVLTGTEKLSPILFAPIELIAGSIRTAADYVTNAMALGANRRLTAYLKNYLPGGATLTMSYSIDGGAWQNLPLITSDALSWPLWVERKFEVASVSGQLVRLKINATGGADARLIAGDFGAAIF